MAFTGVAVIKQVSASIVQITGLSLAGAATGTISLHGGTGAVKTNQIFQPTEYIGPSGDVIDLTSAIDVSVKLKGTGVAAAVPIAVGKTGADPASFLATLTNVTASTASAELEIYLKYHE